MQFESDSVYAMPQVRALLQHEIAALQPLLSGIYGKCGLYIGPHAVAPQAVSGHRLDTMFELHLLKEHLSGSIQCASYALPFASESFDLVLVQHALEIQASPQAFTAELARVLAPEGIALVLGFNPLSPWRPWLALKARNGLKSVQLRSAGFWQKQFTEHDMEAVSVSYLGSLMPGLSVTSAIGRDVFPLRFFARWRGAYVLFARKRRVTLTPIRLRLAARPVNVRARLAADTQRVKS